MLLLTLLQVVFSCLSIAGADKGFERPQTWTEMEDGKDVDVVTLSSNSKEYNDVVSSFASSMAILKASYQHIVEVNMIAKLLNDICTEKILYYEWRRQYYTSAKIIIFFSVCLIMLFYFYIRCFV